MVEQVIVAELELQLALVLAGIVVGFAFVAELPLMASLSFQLNQQPWLKCLLAA